MSASGYFVCQQTDSNCAKLANAMRLRNILVELFASLLCSRTFPLANAADLFGQTSLQYRFAAAIISQPYLLVGRQAYANAINSVCFGRKRCDPTVASFLTFLVRKSAKINKKITFWRNFYCGLNGLYNFATVN